MKASLAKWVGHADALRHFKSFGVNPQLLSIQDFEERQDDYYISLVGELFDHLRNDYKDCTQWARLGNAIGQFITDLDLDTLIKLGIDRKEALLFAAAAFYFGGYPASAYITIKDSNIDKNDETQSVCFDLLAKPPTPYSEAGRRLHAFLRTGRQDILENIISYYSQFIITARDEGPEEWIKARLAERLVIRFAKSNVRSVLPNGGSKFWDKLVASLLDQRPPVWDLFPSQIQAIKEELLAREESCSLQMPTGAGKTALCEILLYWHLMQNAESVAVLLVPYRSLASELRNTLVKRLNAMGLSSRCAYGGTVPYGDEVKELVDTRAIVATPEALSGLLNVDAAFFGRISLVICDEGHLLDGGARGIGLELLLAKLRSQKERYRKFVFISAIVPNIEDINLWLGGTESSVVRSDYRPALAEFAVLRPIKTDGEFAVDLDMHPHEPAQLRYSIAGFLNSNDFVYLNSNSSRLVNYPFSTIKTQTIAAARKSLVMGSVAIFAANKRGDQGAVGLAEELIRQLQQPLPLPTPEEFMNSEMVSKVIEYLTINYGKDWIATKCMAAGTMLHHGDIPQETREVVEELARNAHIKMIICTSTLAEGVNLPIRTLVLYSVQRRRAGPPTYLLARDIKNLVGRAGRASSTTKGLVICANENQWSQVEKVARQVAGEPVKGALLALVRKLKSALALKNETLTNIILETHNDLHCLVDGIDSILIDLAAEEIGEETLVEMAVSLAEQTFASQQSDEESRVLLRNVFELRAKRIVGFRTSGKLRWAHETGARPRMLDLVESGLLPSRDDWADLSDTTDPSLVKTLLTWAWPQVEFQKELRKGYMVDNEVDLSLYKEEFEVILLSWLEGETFAEIAELVNLEVSLILSVYSTVIAFVFQDLVEQGLAILAKVLETQGKSLSKEVSRFPDFLRYGVRSETARILASQGLRHRSAAVRLAEEYEASKGPEIDKNMVFSHAEKLLLADPPYWRLVLGKLVFQNTVADFRLANVAS